MEWRNLRKSKLEMSREETIETLRNNTEGILATLNPDGSPHAIPMNYAYADNQIIMHCAKTGHKIDNIKQNNKVCFTVVGGYDLDKSGRAASGWNIYYRCVDIFGKATFIEEGTYELLEKFIAPFVKDLPDVPKMDPNAVRGTAVIVIDIEHMTGKKNWGD